MPNEIERLSRSDRHLNDDGARAWRVHVGRSARGFHAGIEATEHGDGKGTVRWGTAHETEQAATQTAWASIRDANGGVMPESQDTKFRKLENELFTSREDDMAEIPDRVKALADKAAQGAATAKGTNVDMGGTPTAQLADAYDTKALEAQRAQQRQNALDAKAAASTPSPTPESGKR